MPIVDDDCDARRRKMMMKSQMKKKWCSKEQKNPCRGLGEDVRETETEKDGDRGDDPFAACRGGHVQAVRRLSGDGGDDVKGRGGGCRRSWR